MADKVTVLVEAVLKNEKFKKGVKEMGTNAQKASKNVQSGFSRIKLGMIALVAGVAAVARAFMGLIRTSREFEKAIAEVSAITGGS